MDHAAQIVAVSSEGPTLEDLLDPRFGRAGGFVRVDGATGRVSYLDNGAAQVRAQGAGIQAAELLAQAGVQVLLTGQVGPKAAAALEAAGIRAVEGFGGMTVAAALAAFQAGERA